MLLCALPPVQFRIVAIDRESVFAGKLGQRVRESLVVERSGSTIRIDVAGSYHTNALREGRRLAIGDTIQIRSRIDAPRVQVDRDQIRKVTF